MNKRISVVSLLLSCLLLVGCGSAEDVSAEQASTTEISETVSSEPSLVTSFEESLEESSEEESEESLEMSDDSSEEESSESEESDEEPSEESSEETSEEFSEEESKADESSQYVYEDIDFKAWQKINKDIYAWIRIPGTVINYPILNRPGDNSRYLNRNYYGYADTRGSIFTEDYNSRDFNDPVTLIYGHNMSSGAMFGSIQKTYTKKSFMDEHKELLIILPDKTYKYEIFAAIPYSNIHIMYSYDFTNPFIFDEVMNDMLSVRAMNAVIDRTVKVKSTDHIVILSTCLSGDGSKRYLLLAVRRDS